MNPLKKQGLFWLGVLVLALTLVARAHAGLDWCSYALDNATIGKLSNQHVVKIKDSVFHKNTIIELGNATLATLQTGDRVIAHGDPHFVLQISKWPNWTQFILVNQQDIDRSMEYLSGNSKPNP